MAQTWGKLGRPLPQWSKKPRRASRPQTGGTRGVRFQAPRPRYDLIKIAVLEAIAQLPTNDQRRIPFAATLPEMIVALVLIWLRLPFVTQISEQGGRMFLGGSVVDFLVQLGGRVVVVRVQGDYWHSLPDRKQKDIMQWDRLHFKGYLVADLWEGELYRAWVEGRIKQFVRDGVYNAT